jgi:hypothetical protein
MRRDSIGWIWAPAKNAVFKPAEVYWLLGAKFTGWGPLAPGEEWTPAAQPQQFLNANTTWAAFRQDARVIDPAGFKDRPKEPLGVAAFTLALPSPAFAATRLEAARPVLRAGSTRVVPVLAGVTFQENVMPRQAAAAVPVAAPPEPSPAPVDAPVAVVTNAGAVQAPLVIVNQPQPEPPSAPAEVYYPVPVYTGVVVVNPPERDTGPPRRRRDPAPPPAQVPAKPPAAQNQTAPVLSSPPPRREAEPPKPLPVRAVPPPAEAKPEPERPATKRTE